MTIVKAITFIFLHLFKEELIKNFFCLLLFNNPNTLIIKWVILDKNSLGRKIDFWKPLSFNFVIGYVTAIFVNNKALTFLTSPSKICILNIIDLDWINILNVCIKIYLKNYIKMITTFYKNSFCQITNTI